METEANPCLIETMSDPADNVRNRGMEDSYDSIKVDILRRLLETKITTKILENDELNIFKETFVEALSFHEPIYLFKVAICAAEADSNFVDSVGWYSDILPRSRHCGKRSIL